MSYDGELAERIREHLAFVGDVTEKRMFGGLAFLVGGHMAVAANQAGGLLARVDPDEAMTLCLTPGVEVARMAGKDRPGWLTVEPDVLAEEDDLAAWVERGVAIAAALPPA